jgi:ABC-type transport system involved in multi-copper enzyme maturation permease subunit
MSGFMGMARLGSLQLRRRKILILPAVISVLVLIGLLVVPLGEQEQAIGNAFAVDAAKSTFTGLRFLLILMLVQFGSQLVSGEIERGSMSVIASKPVRRAEIFLGKLAGILPATFVICVVLGAAIGLVLGYRLDAQLIGLMIRYSVGSVTLLLLLTTIAATLSTILGSRTALAATLLAWFVATTAGSAVELLKSESITTGTGGAVRTLAEGYLVVVPKQRLEKFADLLADDGWTINASSLEGLAVLGVWAALGAVLFHYKRNLA